MDTPSACCGVIHSRVKKTKDEQWTEAHGTGEVDIANTDYKDLPEDWKGENKISAEVAVAEIYRVGGKKLDEIFVEEASATIHQKWMERKIAEGYNENDKDWEWAKSLMVPYDRLQEKEPGKDADRKIIRRAIEIFKQQMEVK